MCENHVKVDNQYEVADVAEYLGLEQNIGGVAIEAATAELSQSPIEER